MEDDPVEQPFAAAPEVLQQLLLLRLAQRELLPVLGAEDVQPAPRIRIVRRALDAGERGADCLDRIDDLVEPLPPPRTVVLRHRTVDVT